VGRTEVNNRLTRRHFVFAEPILGKLEVSERLGHRSFRQTRARESFAMSTEIPPHHQNDRNNPIVAVDTGGTFTDVVTSDGRIAKVLSHKNDPAAALSRGIEAATGHRRARLLAHGTTIATNALLERKGGRVALVTNAGFAHLIEIGRQRRPHLYDQYADRPEALVPRDLRYEIGGRIGPDGSELDPLEEGSLAELARLLAEASSGGQHLDSVAVCLLHSYTNPAHEKKVAAYLRDIGFDVVASHEVCPEFREYERFSTTIVDAYLRPVASQYLTRLVELADLAFVMNSAGGLLPASEAACHPAWLLLSGPVGGAVAGAAFARACGFPKAVTLDMGGTSADVALVVDGKPRFSRQIEIGGYPVKLASVDLTTIGAGGGSIAWLDAGGALRVGPQSAGSDPGPACYGRGGDKPTVTDADLCLGRIPSDAPFTELGRLDLEAARSAIKHLGVTPEDIAAVVDANMARAVRKVTAEKGVDPSEVALVAFGGAGPLHACAVADQLGIETVIIPPLAGVLSALGLLLSPVRRDLVRSWPRPLDRVGLEEERRELQKAAEKLVHDTGLPVAGSETALDCRYLGQSWELEAQSVEDFHEVHLRFNGYCDTERPVEVIAIRAAAWSDPFVELEAFIENRSIERLPAISGPISVAEPDCSVFLPGGWKAELGPAKCWVATKVN
jgi:N-methylhydantoinase A/oxoprolinase/acetone carboxylase beta subunit